MKTKRFIWVIFIFALVVTILLIALTQYYVAVALLVGTIIMRHREIWFLLTRRRLPPVDERVKNNTGKAIRNGFIYFAAATAFMMLPFGGVIFRNLDIVHILGALFLSAGLVYMLSYIYYDRAEPKMTESQLRLLKKFMILLGISLAGFIISVFLHNLFDALFNVEEAVFFIIAVIVAPLAFITGLVGSAVMFIKGLARKTTG
jgi:hypothetical protein